MTTSPIDSAEHRAAWARVRVLLGRYDPGSKLPLPIEDTHMPSVSSEAVEQIETHGALVFLVGDKALKIKKPVRFPYMDFSTRALRRAALLHELEINRRTAADWYLAVLGVDERDGELIWTETVGGAEPVLVMRRFPQDRLLDRVLSDGPLTFEVCQGLADAIANFHDAIPVVGRSGKTAAVSGADRTRAVLEINRQGLGAAAGLVFSEDRVQILVESTARAAERQSDLLDQRQQTGRVRQCHGDLHARNIFLDPDDRPVLFDAIEFDDALATVDIGYDLAFLLMDLVHRGDRAAACRVWNGWLESVGQPHRPGGLGRGYEDNVAGLLPQFLSMRAAVRAHVTASQVPSGATDDHGMVQTARSYLDLATDLLKPGQGGVIAIAGLSGSGKSTLARAVAPELGAVPGATILRSDRIRKRLAGVGATDKLPPSAYSKPASGRVYGEIHRRARRLAAVGRIVIADAVYAHPQERLRIRRAAEKAGVPFQGIWLDLPLNTAQDRVATRQGDVSDATPDVVMRQSQFANPPASDDAHWVRLSADRSIAELRDQVRHILPASMTN